MSTFVLDTGMILGYIRGSGYAEYAEKHFAVSAPPNFAVVSVVTIGEMYSLSLQLGWGDDKRKKLKELVRKIPTLDINHTVILEKYAEIDAFSQGKHPSIRLPRGMSSCNMGKNDIWIAATCSVVDGILLTTDHDFDHLDGLFLKVQCIDTKLRGD